MIAYFVQSWGGKITLTQLFWRDMLAFGTLLNLLFLFFILMIYAQRTAPLAAAAVHFLLLPANIFLALTVWRHPQANMGFKSVAAFWFIATQLI